MSFRAVALGAALSALALAALPAAGEPPGAPRPLRAGKPKPPALHPENPRYFLFRGRPAILVTSGEHYGAVLNRDFAHIPYLEELQAHGFNLTRVFSGTYREVSGSFGIRDNTLAPAPGSYLCPGPCGPVVDGGAKFDLESFDPAYFRRLRDFVAQAGRRGIVVEVVLFCTFYDDELWAVSPMNPRNNVQAIGPASRLEVYSGKDARLTTVQERLVRKIVTELNGYDNLYYELCNEPYERPGLTREWNDRMIAAIVGAEEALPPRHLIAQGIAVRSASIADPDPRVSVFNFHAALPESVTLNLQSEKPIADDETGGKGTADFPYRSEGWEFLLAGGAVFSHLDFSFTCRHPAGTAPLGNAPGGGGPAIRRQIQFLKEFVEGFDFLRMRPGVVTVLPGPRAARALVEEGKAYAVYVQRGPWAELGLELSAGTYRAEWVDPQTGQTAKSETFEHAGGDRRLTTPEFTEDIALRLRSG